MAEHVNMTSTGISWLPLLPSHWKTRKIKYSFSERSKKGFPEEPLLVASQNMGVVPKNVYGKRTVEALKDLDKLKLVRLGDYVISLRSFQGGIEYAYYQGIISPAYTILKPTKDFTSAYYKYLFKSKPFIGLLTTCVTGIREGQNIDYGRLKNQYIPVPPRSEQDQIVRFLDWKMSEINKLIGIRKKEIQELEKLQKVIIDKSISYGIKTTIDYKRTNVFYLLKIPAHWELKKLKNICKLGASIKEQLKKYNEDDKIVFLPMEKITTKGGIDCSIKVSIKQVKSGFSSFSRDDVIVAKITPCFENGKGACLDKLETEIGYGTTELFNLRPNNKVLPEYLYYITITRLFRDLGTRRMTGAAGQKRVPATFIKNFMIGIPPLQEQRQILEYIHKETKKIDELINIRIKQCETLLEYKKVVISDVVTGKIDVRNISIPEYEHVDDADADTSDDAEHEAEERGE